MTEAAKATRRFYAAKRQLIASGYTPKAGICNLNKHPLSTDMNKRYGQVR